MINQQNIENYLQQLVNSNQIITFALTGIQEHSAEAIISKNVFGEIIQETILIYEYLDTYKYAKIINRESSDETLESKISNIQKIINDVIILITESLPKSSNNLNYKTDKTDLILSIWKYMIKNHPDLIDPKTIDGFNNLTTQDEQLNDEQKRNKWDLQNWINKLNARNKIEVEIGDTLDQLADVSKRVAILERALMRLFLHVVGQYDMVDDIKQRYSSYMLPIIEAADNNITIDRIDLENEETLMQNLLLKNQKIIDIIKTEYLDKIK